MTKRWIEYMVVGAACAATGCEGALEPPTGEATATLEGRIDADSGNQHSGVFAVRGPGIAADSVVAITVDSEVIGEAEVRDGLFRLDDLPPMAEPFFVEARSAGEATGRALVALGAPEGELTRVMPISAETTAEAEAFAALRAAGEAVDPIALTLAISHELAATADAQAMAAAAGAAQVAERAALAAHGGMQLTADAMAEARARAFERLVEALHGAESEADEAAAWADFHGEAALALQAALQADAEARADAAAAAGFALSGALEGQAGFAAAIALAGETSARAEQAVIDAIAGGDAGLRAAADGAFEAYFQAVAGARTVADVQAAHDGLIAALAGAEGQGASLIELAAEREGIALSAIESAWMAATQITVDTRAALAAQAGDAALTGELYAGLRARVHGELSATLGLLASPAFVEMLTEVVVAGAVLPSPTLVEGAGEGEVGGEVGGEGEGEGEPVIEPGLVLEAVIEGGAAAQAGAEALVDDLRARVEGDAARLVAVAADGRARIIAEGEVVGEMAQVELPAGAFDGLVVLQVLAEGEVVAATVVPELSGAPEGEAPALPPMSAESTVEALVALQAAAEGHLDLAFAQRMIDDATATAAMAEGEIEALGMALWTAQSTFIDGVQADGERVAETGADASARLMAEMAVAAASGQAAAAEAQARFEAQLQASITAATGAGEQAQADAMAEASAAFAATVDALTEGRAQITAAAAEAQARLTASAQVAAELQAELQAEGRAHADAAAAAFEEHADAIRAAADPAAVVAAGAELRATLVGEVDGIAAELVAAARLDVISRAVVEGAIEAIEQAEGRLQGQLELAVALGFDGRLNIDETAEATAAAFADFDARVQAAVETMARAPGFEGQAQAVAALWTATSVTAPE